MGAGQKTRCCVEYCDGAGASPLELLSKLHVMLCTLHAREWRAEHSSAHVRTPEAHRRWREWLKEAGHRAWLLQSVERQHLEAALREQRKKLRQGELERFRSEVSQKHEPKPEPVPRRVTPMALRALRSVANRLRGPHAQHAASRLRPPTQIRRPTQVRRHTGETG